VYVQFVIFSAHCNFFLRGISSIEGKIKGYFIALAWKRVPWTVKLGIIINFRGEFLQFPPTLSVSTEISNRLLAFYTKEFFEFIKKNNYELLI